MERLLRGCIALMTLALGLYLLALGFMMAAGGLESQRAEQRSTVVVLLAES